MDPVPVTSRIVLRRFTGSDLGGLLALDSDPEVMRFLGPVRSRAEIEASTLPRFVTFHARRPGFGPESGASRVHRMGDWGPCVSSSRGAVSTMSDG